MKTWPVRRWTLGYSANIPTGPFRDDVLVEWPDKCTTERFLSLYCEVGEPWGWFDRRLMPVEELETMLDDERRCVGILRSADDARQLGFTEFFCHSSSEVELVYFGLKPHVTGHGFGTDFMNRVLAEISRQSAPDIRIFLTTCEWDSPAALTFYQRKGFVVENEDVRQQPAPASFQPPVR